MSTPQERMEWIEANYVDIISHPKRSGRAGFRWCVVYHHKDETHPGRFYANSLDIAIEQAMSVFSSRGNHGSSQG